MRPVNQHRAPVLGLFPRSIGGITIPARLSYPCLVSGPRARTYASWYEKPRGSKLTTHELHNGPLKMVEQRLLVAGLYSQTLSHRPPTGGLRERSQPSGTPLPDTLIRFSPGHEISSAPSQGIISRGSCFTRVACCYSLLLVPHRLPN